MIIREYNEVKVSPFLEDYLEKNGEWTGFYDYGLHHTDYRKRYTDITSHAYHRDLLVEQLKQYHAPITNAPEVLENIEKLRDPKSVVVIGGQQAGLLTGPLLTIYKIMTIILDAKEKSKDLQVPVVPVFWIAGEDHDFDEINHVYIKENQGMKKVSWKSKIFQKPSMSQMPLNHHEIERWLEQVFCGFGETEHTVELLKRVKNRLYASETVSEFFARLVMDLFEKYGLVLYDSGSPLFTSSRIAFFQSLIQNVEKVQERFKIGSKNLKDAGFSCAVETSPTSAHLFYTYKGNRMMLEYEAGYFSIKNTDFKCSKEELLQKLALQPACFSNNVVTRPLMQEYLFPCLSFVSGPGELVYWAQIYPIFALFQMKMPIVRPRMSLTLFERNISSYLETFSFTKEDVFSSLYKNKKEIFLQKMMEHNVKEEMKPFYKQLDCFHESLAKYVQEIEPAYYDLMKTNREHLRKEVLFVEKKLEESLMQRVKVEANRFQKIEDHLYPSEIFQERVWNVFYFLNLYGEKFLDQLMHLTYTDTCYHYFVNI